MLLDPNTPFRSMVDPQAGTVARQIFSDEQIYQLELERIFARCWNFMCHESQIPNPGDFFLSYIGEESVICTRDKKGGFQVFLNSCRHRGNAVCRAEQGNTRSFLCTYHGWTYDLEGKLIGVPGYKDLYHEQLDRSQWGLVSAGKVQAYKGFVFATMDATAPDLDEYLGPVGRLSIDLIAERGEMKMVPGVQKNLIGCNWKLAVDNVFDWYHAQIAHASAFMSGGVSVTRGRSSEAQRTMQGMGPDSQRVVLGDYGHAISGPKLSKQFWEMQSKATDRTDTLLAEQWRDRPEAKEALGEVGRDARGHPNIFPNFWVTTGGQISLRIPKGPTQTELWWFTMVSEDFTPDERRMFLSRSNHTFGPSGLLEQEDGENWDQSTRSTRGVVARKHPLNFAMNLHAAEVKAAADGGPTHIDTNVNEHAQLWTYRAWADWMDAESWDALRNNHTPAPKQGETV